MQKQITIDGQEVDFVHRKSNRATRMRLAVYGDGRVVLTSPRWQLERMAEEFIREKAGWLLDKLAIFRERGFTPTVRRTKADYYRNREEARQLVTERVEYFAELHGFAYNRVSIKNQRSCWGSCSRKGNLNFNYKLLFLSPEARDYVILHELCHLKEFNHSQKFWSLLETFVPNYRELKRAIRQHKLT